MNKIVYLLLSILIALAVVGCNDYSKVSFYASSAEEVMILVKQHKNDLEKINDAYEAKNRPGVYSDIDHYLELLWASPELMDQWYKIWLNVVSKSKRYKNDNEYLNSISCEALIWFIRTGDKKAVQDLPVLTAFPLYEEAKTRYLNSTPKEFTAWAQKCINSKMLPKYWYHAIIYLKLLESAAISAHDWELASNANVMLYDSAGWHGQDIMIVPVSNLAFYADKTGKLTDRDKDILINFYNNYIKDKQEIYLQQKRREFILKIIKKYNVIPDVTTPQNK